MNPSAAGLGASKLGLGDWYPYFLRLVVCFLTRSVDYTPLPLRGYSPVHFVKVETNLSSGTLCHRSTLSSTETPPRSQLIHNYHPKFPLVHNYPLVDGEDADGENAEIEKPYQDVINGTFPLPQATSHCHQPTPGRREGRRLSQQRHLPLPRLPLIHSYQLMNGEEVDRRERFLGRALLARPRLGARPREQQVPIRAIDLRGMSLLFDLTISPVPLASYSGTSLLKRIFATISPP